MRTAILAVLISSGLQAQAIETLVRRGEQLFTQTCGSGYCHGGRGAGGGAPRLAARGFSQEFINTTVARGVPGTAMNAFGGNLPAADLTAIVAYVSRLNNVANIAAGTAPAAAAPKLPAEAARGKTLFSEAARSFGRCSTCHEVGGFGLAVAAPIQTVPPNAAALRNLATSRVLTAMIGGQAMPALMVANKSTSVTLYDLTVAPPVLRTEEPAAVQTREGSAWRHSNVIGAYSDTELGSILTYLRAAVTQ